MPWQQAWIAGGGILVCLIVSGLIQVLLLFDVVKDWRLSFPLFWLAFWAFLNPTGYLIIGGIRPFGDVLSLISAGVLTQELSLLIGLSVFFATFFSLSRTLIRQLLRERIAQRIGELRFSLALFWAIIPVVTAITCLGMRLPLHYSIIFTALGLIPVLVAVLLPTFLRKKYV